MKRHADDLLNDLKELVLSMGGFVERAIESAVEGFQEANRAKISNVDEFEKEINKLHLTIDEACVKLLALYQPMATDLRFIIAAIKINTDLERMGDQAVNIARNAARNLDNISLELRKLVDYPKMVKIVRTMVREVLDAFVRRDSKLARKVLNDDDSVDIMKNAVFHDVAEYLRKNSEHIDQGLSLILIARNLEKLGDHATNIAEDVIFLVSGEDVRHPQIASEKSKE